MPRPIAAILNAHPAQAAWLFTTAVLLLILSALGQPLLFATIVSLFLAGLFVGVCETFMLIPTPLDLRQWPFRIPGLTRLAATDHWLNPFHVETFVLVSPLPRERCRALLRSALGESGAPPWKVHGLFGGGVIGGVRGDRFGMRRSPGMFLRSSAFAVAAGELRDAGTLTRIELTVALSAPQTYALLPLFVGFVLIPAVLLIASAVDALRRGTPAAISLFLAIAAALVLTGVIAVFVGRLLYGPLKGKRRPETVDYLDFLRDAIQARLERDVLGRD